MSMQDMGDDAGAGAGGGAPPTPAAPQGTPRGAPPSFLAATTQPPGGAPQPSAPGMGNQADAIVKLGAASRLIQEALPGLPQGSPIHMAALKAAQGLSKHTAQGAPSAGVQKTLFGDMQQGTMRNQLLQKIMAARGQTTGVGGGGAAGGGAAGAGQQPAGQPAGAFPGA